MKVYILRDLPTTSKTASFNEVQFDDLLGAVATRRSSLQTVPTQTGAHESSHYLALRDRLHAGVAYQDVPVQEVDSERIPQRHLMTTYPWLSGSKKDPWCQVGTMSYLGLHQRHLRYLAQYDYISGPANVMVDDCLCYGI